MREPGIKGGACLAAVLLAAAVASCGSTEMNSTWTAPNAKAAPMAKVAVLALAKDEGVRRTAEDEFVQHLKGAQGVPSYKALAHVDRTDKKAVREKLREQGFDGVLVMRLAGASEQVAPVPFDAYYPIAYGEAYGTPVQTETVVHVVSSLYSVDGKLIWSGTSSTFDPGSARKVVDDVSRALAKKLEKEGLLI